MAGKYMDPAPTWNVVGVSPRVSVTTGTIPVEGHNVTFVTAAGNRSQVFVPDSVTSLDAARDIIAARVAYVDGLAALTG